MPSKVTVVSWSSAAPPTQSHSKVGRKTACVSSKANLFPGAHSSLLFSKRLASSRSSPRCRSRKHLQTSAISAPELGTPDAMIGTAAGDPGKYKNSDWASAFKSQLREYDYWATRVEGTIPDAMRGTLFRNGPGRFERGDQKYEHMLDGDGYVCAFSFSDDGRMHFRSSFVKTKDLAKEAEANAVLYRNTFGTQPKREKPLQNAFDLYLKNPANTNVVLWGDRLLALWEAGCPFELDPYTLKTLPGGPATLDGFLRSGIAPSTTGAKVLDKAIGLGKACTAHPHVVHGEGLSDRLAIFSWCSHIKPVTGAEMKVEINEYDQEWQKVAGQTFTMPKSFFNPHDFAISKTYYVFFQNALSFKMTQYLLGLRGPAQCVNFDEGPMKVYVVPRHGGEPLVIDSVEPAFLIHHANAYEEGDEIVVWSSGWSPEAVGLLASTPGSGMLGSWKVVMDGDFNDVPVSSLWSHRINTKTGEVKRRCLFAQSNDHPRVNPSFYSKPTRYCYVNMCMTDDADISPQPEHLAPGHEPVPPASDVVPEPERLGKTWQCIPDEVLLPPDSVEESDFSWTTKASSSVSSVLPSDSPISVPQSRHAYAPRDLSPYTSEPLPVGGRPVQPTKPLKQSILTAKDRLKKLSKLEFSVLCTLLNVPKAQGGPQDKESQAQSEVASAETSFDEGTSVDEDDASSRAMGSLEWLNLCSGPPKAFTRVDTHTGEAQTWFPGRRCFCEELIFVPGPNAETKEDDGYLLGLVYNAAKHKSFLAILDAADFSKGPVAKIWLKNHVPHGLHGFFSPKYYGPSA